MIAALLMAAAIGGAVFRRQEQKITWVALGDSITCGCDEERKSYADYLVQEHPEVRCRKKGVIGYCMVDLYRNRERMLKDVVGQEVEIVTVFAGTNDFGTDVPLSEFEADCDAYMKYLKKTFPEAELVFYTPLYRDYFGENKGGAMIEGTVNHLGYSLYDYVGCIKKLGEKNQVATVDLSGSGYLNAENLRELTIDGLHPNQKENLRLAEVFEEKVLE